MAHTREKRWSSYRAADGSIEKGVNDTVGEVSERVIKSLLEGEELFQQLTEMWTFAGGTDQAMADQLFKDSWINRDSDGDGNMDTQANAEEVAMASDAKTAMVAIHNLYQALVGETIAADDRGSKLRRMI